jgi:hypothetical protein
VPSAGPATVAEALSVRPTPSEGVVVILVILVLLFLALHGRVDGGDPRLGSGTGPDSGRFQ